MMIGPIVLGEEARGSIIVLYIYGAVAALVSFHPGTMSLAALMMCGEFIIPIEGYIH